MTETATAEKKPENKGLAKVQIEAGHRATAIVAQNVDQAFRLAQAVAQSGLAPDSYKNDPKKILIGIMSGAEVGFPPMAALKNIAVINGRPCIWGDGLLGLCHATGELEDVAVEYVGEKGTKERSCTVTARRKGYSTPFVSTFSMADAAKANLTGKPGPWQSYPDRMLLSRARAFALRDAFADVLSGLSVAEEVQDIPEKVKPEAVDMGALKDDDATGPQQAEPEAPGEGIQDAEIEPETPASEAPAGADEPPEDMFPGDAESAPEIDYEEAGKVVEALKAKIDVVTTSRALANLFATEIDPALQKLPEAAGNGLQNHYERKLAALKKAGK